MPPALAPSADPARPATARTHRYAPPSPALLAGISAQALRRHGCAAQVLVILHDLLRPNEDRRAPPWYVASLLGIHRVQASRAIHHLAAVGLIVAGPRVDGHQTYRLPAGDAAAPAASA